MRVRGTISVAAFAAVTIAGGNALAGEPVPTLFAPGAISGPANDGAPTFTPDGKTIYFDRSNNNWAYIVTSHRTGETWSRPVVASFAGPSSDQQPALSPDGQYLIYVSSRPRADNPKRRQSHLYRVDRVQNGWSKPRELPPEVNFADSVFKPSIATNGDLYFMSTDNPRGGDTKWRLYRSAFVSGAYQKAAPLPFSDGSSSDVDPAIAPDESYIVFGSKGRKEFDDGHEHLFIAFRKGDSWSAPAVMHYQGDDWGADDGEANIGADGKTIYFSSGRSARPNLARTRDDALRDYENLTAWDNSNNNIWMLPLAPYLHTAS